MAGGNVHNSWRFISYLWKKMSSNKDIHDMVMCEFSLRSNVARGDNGSGKGGGGFKLFGVNINLQEDLHNSSSESSSKRKRICKDKDVVRNNKSMGNLQDLCNLEQQHNGIARDDPGYHSDNSLHVHSRRPVRFKKKAIPWTQSEHKCFLIGLEKLGKGHWKGISKNYVPTKTPTQVASHAQKYFIRINNVDKKRASPFDTFFSGSNSPPHSSTAASSNASESSQQAVTAAVNPLKKASRKSGLNGLSANIAANKKKPPVSPPTRADASDAHHISNITGDPGQSFPAPHVMQQTELRPMLTNIYPFYIYDSSRHAYFLAQGLFRHPHPIIHGTSQAQPATTVAANSAVVHH